MRTRDQRPEKLTKRSGSRVEIGEGVRFESPEIRERTREEGEGRGRTRKEE